jgi:glycosyltransferase involved in cell wall biosynthesis
MTTWLLVAGDFRRVGGMDRANHELATYLSARGDEVHLVAHSVDDDLEGRPGIVVHPVSRPARSDLLGSWLLDREGRRVARDLGRGPSLLRVVTNGGNCVLPGLNWVHMVHSRYSLAHESAPLRVRLKNRLAQLYYRRTERRALAASHLVIANSELTRRDLVDVLHVDPGLIRVIALGSDPAVFGPLSDGERERARASFRVAGDGPLVAFVGALGYECRKGFDTLLDAWRRLCAEPGWTGRLLAAGGGSLPFWRGRIEAWGLGGSIELLGTTDRIPELLAASDVFVSPTRYDAYGLNVHEALCRGVPAIVTRAAGVAEKYPPELAELLLDDPESGEELAARIRACLVNGERLKPRIDELGARLRAWTWRDMSAEIVAAAEAAP